jgi:hypothetical protein
VSPSRSICRNKRRIVSMSQRSSESAVSTASSRSNFTSKHTTAIVERRLPSVESRIQATRVNSLARRDSLRAGTAALRTKQR